MWGKFKEPKAKASKAPVPMHPLLAGFLLAWRERTKYAKQGDYVFPSVKLRGKKPLSASIMVEKYLRPAAISAGVIPANWKGRFFADTLVTHWNKIVITDPGWRPSPHWRVEGGFDHGKTNPTALLRAYIDGDGVIYFCGEYYMPEKKSGNMFRKSAGCRISAE